MNKHSQKSRKQAIVKATNRTLLINLPAIFIASIALATPGMETDKQMSQVNPNSGTSTSPLNSRPTIFDAPPYKRSQRTSNTNSNIAPTTEPTPDGVTPTTPTNELPDTPTMEPTPGSILQPPLPEEQQAPKAVVTPIDGKVNIKLINATKAAVTYQVVGDTEQRTLTGDADVTLQDIKTPVTVTFVREDGGLLKVNPQAASAGLLEVTLDETTSLDESDSAMQVQQTGIVLLN